MEKEISPLNKYPIYTNNVVFVEKAGSMYIKLIKEDKVQPIRPHVWNILKIVDGTKTIDQIISILKESWEINESDILSFFQDSERRNIFILSDIKQPKIAQINNNTRIFPEIFSVVLTDGCNIRCNYCFGNYGELHHKASFLPIECVDSLFKRMSEKGTKGVELTGGEPLYHPNFLEIYQSALKYFSYVTILSNGVLFNESFFQIYEGFKDKTYFQITIDGGTEKTNSIVRQVKNTWKRTLDNIKILSNMRAKLSVVYTLTYENKDELLSACELLETIGVKHLQIAIPDTRGRGTNLHLPCGSLISDQRSDYAKELVSIAKIAHDKYIKMFAKVKATKLEDIKVTNCGAGWLSGTIYCDGDVFVCQSLFKSLVIGNVLTNDIGSIFENNPVVNFLSNFSKDAESSKCDGCEYKCAVCLYRIVSSNIDLLRRGKSLCPIAIEYNLNNHFDFSKLIEFSIPNRIYND